MIEFHLPGTHCSHCASLVVQALKLDDPQARIVDLNLGTRTVRLESTEGANWLTSALTEAGYPPFRTAVAGAHTRAGA